MQTLFRLPAPKRIEVTRDQIKMLDLIELRTGRDLPDKISRPVLRRLIKAGLVIVVTFGPATYRLSPVGRMVRSRPRHQKRTQEVEDEPSRVSA
jgi:hypothetical protein